MTNNQLAKQLMNEPPQGWQCPVCKKVHAPHVASCGCCADTSTTATHLVNYLKWKYTVRYLGTAIDANGEVTHYFAGETSTNDSTT